MPPNRTSRPRSIPQNLIVNWRPSDLRDAAKPVLRRPVTACDACRTAKSKCSGKKDCDRCSARGLNCTYASQTVLHHSPPRGDSAQPPPTPATWPMYDTSAQGVPANVHASSTAAGNPPNSTNYQPSAALESSAPAGRANDLQDQSIRRIKSGPINITSGDQVSESTAHSDTLDNAALQCRADPMLEVLPQGSGNPLPVFGDSTQAASSFASEQSTSCGFQNHQVLSSSCLCRPNLMLCLPTVTSAMQDKRLDEVFKVTGELIKCCQDVMDCQTNQVSCTDLLLVVTALQEAHPCFDHIVKSDDLDSAVKVSFGGYEVSLNDMNLRAMLVMDLVQKTDTLLTSVSSTGQGMVDRLSEPSRLARANIAYLEEMIGLFKTILRCVTVHMTEAVSPGGRVSETLLNEFAPAPATT